MSGIRFTTLDRSALPILDQKMKAVIANTDDANFLAYPTISASGRSEMVDQCVAFNRPDSINFTHATCRYLPSTFNFTDRAQITISKTSNNSLSVDSCSRMSYNTLQISGGTDYLWIAPAGLATSTEYKEFPATDSSWCHAHNGTNGECYNSSRQPTMMSDYFDYSVGARYPHDVSTSITSKLTSYVTVNYFIDMTRNDGASLAGPINIVSDSHITGINHDSLGIIWNGTGPTWSQVDDTLANTPDKCMVTQYTDRNVFTDASPYGTSYAYTRTDMYYKQTSGYIYAYMPYMCIKIDGFDYDPNYPDASLTFGLQYNLLTYGVADDPALGVYGMIYNNDDYNRTSIRVDTSMLPTGDDVQLFTTHDFIVYGRANLNVVNIRIKTMDGSNVSADILKQGYVQSSASYSGNMDQTEQRTNQTIGSSYYSLYTYANYDLDSRVQTFTDITITYSSKKLRFNAIKLPGSSSSSATSFIFHIDYDGDA